MRAEALDRLFRAAVLRALEGWRVGRLELELPDGTTRGFGPEAAEDRVRVRVHRERLFRRFALQGDLGAGEAYVDGDWSADDLPLMARLSLLNQEALVLETPLTRLLNLGETLRQRLRANTRSGSRRNIRDHYDLSNELFALFLDETMTYSSAVFEREGQPLAEAQRNKYRMLAEKACLGPGQHVLEIGCGWGGFAIEAVRRYGCRVTGITLSERQLELGRRRVAEAGLGDRIELRLQDYREVPGRFDRIVSIEMFEALGREHWPVFFRRCDELLAPDGVMSLQAIALPDHRFETYARHGDWIQKRIFPGSLLASVHHVTGAMSRSSRLIVNHLEDVGLHYAETLRRWRAAFRGRLDEVRALGFDERFVRTWDYYLSVCEASFATRSLQNLQLVLTRPMNKSLPGIPGARRVAA